MRTSWTRILVAIALVPVLCGQASPPAHVKMDDPALVRLAGAIRCRAVQSEAKMMLRAVHVTQLAYWGEFGLYPDLAGLVASGHLDARVAVSPHYRVDVRPSATHQGYVATATDTRRPVREDLGAGADTWTITEAGGAPTAISDACAAPLPPLPADETLGAGLAVVNHCRSIAAVVTSDAPCDDILRRLPTLEQLSAALEAASALPAEEREVLWQVCRQPLGKASADVVLSGARQCDVDGNRALRDAVNALMQPVVTQLSPGLGSQAAPEPVERTVPPAPPPPSLGEMTETFKASVPDYTGCFKDEVRRNPAAPGVVTIEFTILNDGTTKAFRIVEPGYDAQAPLWACVETAVGRLRFRPFSGSPQVFRFPFKIKRPGGQVPPPGSGPLTKSGVLATIKENKPDVVECVARQRLEDPERAKGLITMRWVVARDGTASQVTVMTEGHADGVVAPCLAHAISRWRFPAHDGQVSTPITFPFRLEKF